MTQYTKTIVSNQNYVASSAQDLLRDELLYLENLPEFEMTYELIDDLLGPMRQKKVPMFVETLKSFLTKGQASISRSNYKQYPHLHIVEETKGDLIAYVYNRGDKNKKVRNFKSPTDVFYDHFDPQVP